MQRARANSSRWEKKRSRGVALRCSGGILLLLGEQRIIEWGLLHIIVSGLPDG